MIPAHVAHAIEQGFEVFPLKPGSKAPLTKNGFKDASKHWESWPVTDNYGIHPTGDMFVLDFDPRNGNGQQWWFENDHDRTSTRVVESGRGDGGVHVYLRGPLPDKNLLPAGVDIKSSTGYIVGPGSVHPDTGCEYKLINDKPIAAAPSWLYQQSPTSSLKRFKPPVYEWQPSTPGELEGWFQGQQGRFYGVSEGEGFNEALWGFVRDCFKYYGDPADKQIYDAVIAHPAYDTWGELDEADETTINSALVSMNEWEPWEFPTPSTQVNKWDAMRFDIEGEWDSAPVTETWLLENFIPAHRLGVLYSPAKAGKSLLALEIAANLARGTEVLGQTPDRPYTVVYLDYENDRYADTLVRLKKMGFDKAALSNLVILPFPVMGKYDTVDGGLELLDCALHFKADLVIIDTLSRVVEGGENDADTYKYLYQNALVHLKAANIAVLRLDHSGKDVTKGQRGSSAKMSDVDYVWQLEKHGQTRVSLRLDDSRCLFPRDYYDLFRQDLPVFKHQILATPPEVPETDPIDALAELMDRQCIPVGLSQREMKDWCKDAGIRGAGANLQRAYRVYCENEEAA